MDVLKPFHRSCVQFIEQAVMTFRVNTGELAAIELITSVVNLIGWPAHILDKDSSTWPNVPLEQTS